MRKQVKDEMTRRVAYVSETDCVRKAHELMTAFGIQHVPVVRERKVVGIISDRDLLLIGHQNGHRLIVPEKPVSEVMSQFVITCSTDTSIAQVATQMLTHHIHCLPVVGEEDELVGIITSTDLLRILRDREWALSDRIPFRYEKPAPLFSMA